MSDKAVMIPGIQAEIKDGQEEVPVSLVSKALPTIHTDDMKKYAKPSCNNCFGRGWERKIGYNRNAVKFNELTHSYEAARMDLYSPCKCTIKKLLAEGKENIIITSEKEETPNEESN